MGDQRPVFRWRKILRLLLHQHLCQPQHLRIAPTRRQHTPGQPHTFARAQHQDRTGKRQDTRALNLLRQAIM